MLTPEIVKFISEYGIGTFGSLILFIIIWRVMKPIIASLDAQAKVFIELANSIGKIENNTLLIREDVKLIRRRVERLKKHQCKEEYKQILALLDKIERKILNGS